MEKKKHILMITANNIAGGGPKHITEILRAASPEKFEFSVVCPPPELAADPHPPSEEWQSLVGPRLHVIPLRRLSVRNIFRIRNIVQTQEIDMIHTHGKGAGLFGRLTGLLTGTPVVHTWHGLHSISRNKITQKLYWLLERFLGRLTTVGVSVSTSEAALLVRLGWIPPDRLEVINNGVDVQRIASAPESDGARIRREFGVEEGAFLVGSVGRIDPVKGFDLLVHAARLVLVAEPQMQFVVIGEAASSQGKYFLQLQDSISMNPSLEGKFKFVGFRNDVASCLRAFDLYVSSSEWEGMPYTILEAMAAQLPVVATDVGGHRDAVVHGETGWLVASEDANALATALLHAAKADNLAQLGANGLERVRDRFDVGQQMGRLQEVYERVSS